MKSLRQLSAAPHDLLFEIWPRPAVAGTYVVVFELECPKPNLVIGRLGTFDFPAGFYAYIGSAFGGGGVKARTDRHLTRNTVKRWNVDFLKPFATGLQVWWTHDTVKRECAWAALVGRLPGATCPAPKFGAADCKSCPAHLVWFPRLPVFRQFRRLAMTEIRDHDAINLERIRDLDGERNYESGIMEPTAG